ncbi:unnamed protein product [Prunus brigantina]
MGVGMCNAFSTCKVSSRSMLLINNVENKVQFIHNQVSIYTYKWTVLQFSCPTHQRAARLYLHMNHDHCKVMDDGGNFQCQRTGSHLASKSLIEMLPPKQEGTPLQMSSQRSFKKHCAIGCS